MAIVERSLLFSWFLTSFSVQACRLITCDSSIVNGGSDALNYLVIIVAMDWLLERFERERKREKEIEIEMEIDRDRERKRERERERERERDDRDRNNRDGDCDDREMTEMEMDTIEREPRRESELRRDRASQRE